MTPVSRMPMKPRQPRPETKAQRFPIVIASWPRHGSEIVQVSLDRFKNGFTIDIRAWWRDARGVFKPKRDGLTLSIAQLPNLAAALNRALDRAAGLGLVKPVPKDLSTAGRPDQFRDRR